MNIVWNTDWPCQAREAWRRIWAGICTGSWQSQRRGRRWRQVWTAAQEQRNDYLACKLKLVKIHISLLKWKSVAKLFLKKTFLCKSCCRFEVGAGRSEGSGHLYVYKDAFKDKTALFPWQSRVRRVRDPGTLWTEPSAKSSRSARTRPEHTVSVQYETWTHSTVRDLNTQLVYSTRPEHTVSVQ